MIKGLLIFLITLSTIPSLKASQMDISDDLSGYFKTGDYASIAKKFASSVELNINDAEDVYSKVQGEQILKDFFQKHQPQKSSIHHKINTNPNYRYCVLALVTAKNAFRVSITMKKINNEYLITELRIEPSKD